MQNKVLQKLIHILFFLVVSVNSLFPQSACPVVVDTANLVHISCPNGGPVGGAQILQAFYINYSWQNVSNGQLYNGGGGNGGPSRNDLDPGLYVITASNPYSWQCADTAYSDTFEIFEAQTLIQYNPAQACPDTCNIEVNFDMQLAISNVFYEVSWNNGPIVVLPVTIDNQCGGINTYEIIADGNSCGQESTFISQYPQMNLGTNVVDASCSQSGSATVNILSLGNSAGSVYCMPTLPFVSGGASIYDVDLIGDNNTINNYTTCPNPYPCYVDYTSTMMADVTAGNTYTLNLEIGSCNPSGITYIDKGAVYIDWNIDGDFDDAGEIVAIIGATQSPSIHSLPFTVPNNAIVGQSRMRIVVQNAAFQNIPINACFNANNQPYFSETEDYTIQINGSVALPLSYLWSDGQITQTAGGLNTGTYTVVVTDGNGCTATDTAIVGGSGGTATVSASGAQTICYGDAPTGLSSNGSSSGTYSWSPASDFINPNVQNPVFSTSPLTSTMYTVTFTDIYGCVASDNVLVTVQSLPTIIPVANPGTTLCAGEDLTLTGIGASSGTLYNWNNGVTDGVSFTPPQTWWNNPPTPLSTTYTVTATDALTQCTNSANITIDVNPVPLVSISAIPNPACLGDDIVLTATPSLTSTRFRFQYNDGSGWLNITAPVWGSNNPVTFNNISTTTQFRVKAREYNGCDVGPWSPQTTVPIVTFPNLSIWHN